MATRRDSRRTGLWPLAYMGVEPVSPPLMLTDDRAPTANDYRGFNVGTWWVDRSTAPTEDVWILVNKDANVARWIQFTGAVTGILTLTGDVGGAVPADPATLDIEINGTAASPYIFHGYPGSYAIELEDDGTLAYFYDCDVGTATPAANLIDVIGGVGITTTGAGNTITIDATGAIASSFPTDAGTATPAVGVLNVLGGTHIGTTGAGNTVTVNLDTDIADTYTTDAGNAIPVAGVLNVLGGTHCATAGAGNTVTVNVDDGDLADSFVTDAGTATPALGVINVLGGLNIGTTGAGSTVTVNLDDPGQGVVQSNGAGVLSASTGTDGQILIDSTAGGNAAWANITSAGGTITVANGANTIDLAVASPGGTKFTRFTSSDTWTKDANAKFIKIFLTGGGAGGGSGRRGLSTQSGGGGGGGTGDYIESFVYGDIAPASVAVVIGAGGAAGVMQTVNNTDGNAGGSPGTTHMGQLNGNYPALITGGPAGVNGSTGLGTRGRVYILQRQGIGTASTNAAGGGEKTDGGDAVNSGDQWMTFYSGSGGGGGGGADAVAERSGGMGGGLSYSNIWGGPYPYMFIAGAIGGLESVAINGANGVNAAGSGCLINTGGTGGGGGGGQSVGGAAGTGGDAGIPSAGGGGGGGSINGTDSGAGGAGGRGEVVIIEYLG